MVNGSFELSYDSTNSAKGIFAILIMLSHICLAISELPVYLIPIRYLGFPVVSCFFFLSAYGLHVSFLKKGNAYWDNYIRKRFSRVVVPFLVTLLLWLPASLIINDENRLNQYLLETFSLDFIAEKWYIWVIISLYFVYYIVFKNFRKNTGCHIVLAVIVAFVLVNCFVKTDKQYLYSSISGFAAGLYYANYRNILMNYFSKKYFQRFTLMLISLSMLFVMRLALKLLGIENIFLGAVCRNLISFALPVCLAIILTKHTLKNRILSFFGRISYEIYLVHPFVIYALCKIANFNSLIFGILTLIMSIVLAIMINKIVKLIQPTTSP